MRVATTKPYRRLDTCRRQGFIGNMVQSVEELQAEALRLKTAGRLSDAIGLYRAAVAAARRNRHARHNLAAALGDAGNWTEAEAEIREAFGLGLDAGESWLVLARALLPQGRLDESETAYREALKRKPTLYDAHRELAQLVWMAEGNRAGALASLEAAVRAAPGDMQLRLILAQALDNMGDAEQSLATLAEAMETAPDDFWLAIAAANTATKLGRPEEALTRSLQALRLAPREMSALLARSAALLCAGRPQEASEVAVSAIRLNRNNQSAIAHLATSWRMLGNSEYAVLHDYDRLVRAVKVSPPEGWSSLERYLSDLSRALRHIHRFREHPFGQSVRHGSQAQNLLNYEDPAIRALGGVLDGPIRSYIDALGRGADPIRSRNNGTYRMQGIWSVLLYPDGFHTDHVHPEGWISSAFYVEPVDRPGHEGWIKFGQPGTPTSPALGPDHFVKPEPGMLVLFPSYIWHGTVPFTGESTRLTCAMDLVPASP